MAASDDETAVAYLRSPLAIRARCENILEAGFSGTLEHFAIEMTEMPRVIDEVVAVTRANYPSLDVPVHGRINHFRAGGIDRVAELDPSLASCVEDMLDGYVRTALAIARSRLLVSALDRAPRARSRAITAAYLQERSASLRQETEARLTMLRDAQLATLELLQYAVERAAYRTLVLDLALTAPGCASRTTRSSETPRRLRSSV